MLAFLDLFLPFICLGRGFGPVVHFGSRRKKFVFRYLGLSHASACTGIDRMVVDDDGETNNESGNDEPICS